MHYGHTTGTKRERPKATDWYREEEENNIRRIEAAWQARQTHQPQEHPHGSSDARRA